MYLIIEYSFLIITLMITLGAQYYIDKSYQKTKKINNKSNMTGYMAAKIILEENGLADVKIEETTGLLSDHYDSKNKVIRLSPSIYQEKTIAAVSVAAHECGHAIQDKNHYFFLRLRNLLIPLVNFASIAGYISITIGIFASALNLIWIGIIMEIIILLFQIITLPIEINASKRALNKIDEYNILQKSEQSYSKQMLIAAALTYVASVATAILQIIRLILIFTRRDD